MSVETALGISAEIAQQIIAQRWEGWVEARPALARVDRTNVRGWLRRVDLDQASAALRGLAQLAATDGGDDTEAAAVLAWVMLPAACRVAGDLADLHPDIDAIVASQLWIEVRTFNWRASRKVAGNLTRSLRRGVLRECGAGEQTLMEARTIPWQDLLDQMAGEPAGEDPLETLVEVLDLGVAQGIIKDCDRSLLLDMVEAARASTRRHNGARSLLAVSAVVGPKRGMPSRTVRRRGRRALDALAARAADLAEIA